MERFEHANVPLLQPAFDKGLMREQLIGEVTIKKSMFSEDHPGEGYTRRELVDKEEIVLGCSGTKEELCRGKMELACVREYDVEFSMACAREGRDDVVYAEGAISSFVEAVVHVVV